MHTSISPARASECIGVCIYIDTCLSVYVSTGEVIYIFRKEQLCLDLLKDKYTLLNSKPSFYTKHSHVATLRYYVFTCHFSSLFHSTI